MKKTFYLLIALLLVSLTFSNLQAQNTKYNNSSKYSKELKNMWKKSTSLKSGTHKDKKEVGIIEGYREVAKSHPEEEGLCNLYIADFYMYRSNNLNYDSAILYYMLSDGKISDRMPYEKIISYNNLVDYFVSKEDFDRAVSYAELAASLDSAQYRTLARLCIFGGPEYFNPILAIEYVQIALRNGVGEDLFPLQYASHYIVNTINDGTFDSVAFEYNRKAFIKIMRSNTKDEAVKYLEKAAERNYFPAVLDLATKIASRQLCADQDHKTMCERAITLLKPLVDANYPPALHATGMAVEYSNLIMGGALVSPKGFQDAFPYFEKGCNLGYPPSIAEVGRYYELNLGRLFGLNPDLAIEYYNTAEKEGYYHATNLKKALIARAKLDEAKRELFYSTVSLIEQTKKVRETFESREFEKKYKASKIQNGTAANSSSIGGKNSSSNNVKNDSHAESEQICRLCLGSGKCCGNGDHSQILHNNYCKGSGVCYHCGGEGILNNPMVASGPGSYIRCSWCDGLKKCKYCKGTGLCSSCNGTGKK